MNLENLKFWKHTKTGEVIKNTCHEKLTEAGQRHFVPTEETPTHYYSGDDSGDFVLSAIVGVETGSALIGGAIGGDLIGGMVGEEIHDMDSNNSAQNNDVDFGGGSFGGGGSSDSWDSSPDTSSFDSGSSVDSSNYDSGSSSFDSSSSNW